MPIHTQGNTIIQGNNIKRYKGIQDLASYSLLDISLDASDESTVTLNGLKVSRWYDNRWNGKYFEEFNSSSQPDYSLTQNGLKVITFDGNIDRLRFTMPSTLNSSDFTVFVVYKAFDTGRHVLVGDYGSSNSYGIGFELHLDTYQRIYFDNNPNAFSDIGAWASGEWNIYGAQRDTYNWTNINETGIIKTEVDSTPSIIGYNPNQRFTIGRDGRTGETAFYGSIGEILIYNSALPVYEINAINSILINKWNVPV